MGPELLEYQRTLDEADRAVFREHAEHTKLSERDPRDLISRESFTLRNRLKVEPIITKCAHRVAHRQLILVESKVHSRATYAQTVC